MPAYLRVCTCVPCILYNSPQPWSGLFIIALQRFQARRGNLICTLGDNGSNSASIVSYGKYLLEIDQKRVADELTARGVQRIFNQPAAPWFDGA